MYIGGTKFKSTKVCPIQMSSCRQPPSLHLMWPWGSLGFITHTYCAVTVMLVHGPGPYPPHPPPHRHCLPRSRASWLRWTQPRGGTRREVKAGGERASLPLLCLCGFSSSSCVSSMDGRRVCQGPRWDASPWAPVTASGCLRL